VATKCPKCQTENPETAKFCSECATPLQPYKDIGVTQTLEIPAKGLALGLTFAGRYQFVESAGDGKLSFISRDDIADACVHCLTTENYENKIYNITGNALLYFEQACDILSRIINKKIIYN
jgi:hypothetical protein